MLVLNQTIGRWAELHNEPDVKDLSYGMDFREPRYRREVFLRFYQFHLKYKSHPGGVYFAMPYLATKKDMDQEQKLWMGFINGCSQNIVTTNLIMEKFPSLDSCDVGKLDTWWNTVHDKFKVGSGWDSDRKYFKVGKTGFPACVDVYKKNVKKYGTQEKMFNAFCTSDKYKSFSKIWDLVRKDFMSFGRLSTFSYLEYLRILGIPIDCGDLFLEDINGSKSHRNGLCKVLGRDDLDWWDAKESHNPDFPGYEAATIEWLKDEAELLLKEAAERYPHEDVSYFTLESTFCCYKSWYRPNRRYPNVYMDMMHDRIKYAESQWGDKFSVFWEMREKLLPKHLLLEYNPSDCGLKPDKQNHFRTTGQVIMMDEEWECFRNDFNERVAGGSLLSFL